LQRRLINTVLQRGARVASTRETVLTVFVQALGAFTSLLRI